MMLKISAQKGFGLVEVMIALVLGLLLSLAVSEAYVTSSRAYRANELQARLQETGRFVLSYLADELRQADYWGRAIDPYLVDNFSVSGDCLGPLGLNITGVSAKPEDDLVQPLAVVSVEGTTANIPSCLPQAASSANGLPPRDIISIRYAGAQVTPPLAAGVYVKSFNNEMLIFSSGGGSPPSEPSNADNNQDIWNYVANTFYIRTQGDQVELARLRLDASGLSVQPLLEGIEGLRILWGYDGDAGDPSIRADGAVDQYINASQVPNWQRVIAARIYVLVRSEILGGYTDTRTYQLGDVSVNAFNDNRYRLVMSKTVTLRNLRLRNYRQGLMLDTN
ncbi:prepilin-type N-terminal cleavage/methylation domain-containing protein [Allopseudospirillum japonicum]|uniref:Prepilin-type N-terminal cleavage/methylation domain-containing protein n=1 Tax=Allopseudospirillum japonicum TaxID=64971 RepID=A0A1H6QT76_9GAMM|nr:PilW family protein [Allopseudospirillum japonicum]SEI46901.1 prepilin-type N-terminal cleavage/methylation domain-containing protein [Allopseudospirillum japonicum]